MNRTEAIAMINDKLAVMDDETILNVADIVQDMNATNSLRRPLSARERELIEQSKVDFREGRTFSIQEARNHSDAFVKALRAKYPKAP